MKVAKVGNVYKVARITGPQHNFLGLVLCQEAMTLPIIERLEIDQKHSRSGILDEDEVLAAVQQGIAEANQKFDTHFYLARLQYVPTDTPDLAVYSVLARQIVAQAWMDISPEVSRH